MIYVVVGLVATNIVGVLVALAFRQQAKSLAEDLERTEAERAFAASTGAEEKRRLESVIASVKTELKKAEADLAACSTPDAVRTRLRGLFP